MEEKKHIKKITPLPRDTATLPVPVSLNIEGAVIKMKLLSEEQIDTLSANSSGVSLNALLGIIGIESGLIGTLYSDSIKPDYTPYFKITVILLTILMIYFGVRAILEWKAVKNAKERIKTQSKTVDIVSPILTVEPNNE